MKPWPSTVQAVPSGSTLTSSDLTNVGAVPAGLQAAAGSRSRFKLVHTSRPIYSVRIGLAYRALGVRDGDEIIWFWIGSHTDYDRLLRELAG